MNINWFPGHMKKAAEEVQKNLSLVDIVLELVDARIPYSSSNPMLKKIIGDKRCIKVLVKSDLADEEALNEFIRKYDAVAVNSLKGKGIKKLKDKIAEASVAVNERLKKRGRKPREARVMVVGVPNVGKSSLINRLAGKNVCKAGNKPGVTRGKQWINIAKGITLCDTAGILWPKFEDQETALKLALTGAIRDEILSLEDLAKALLMYPKVASAAVDYYELELSVEVLEKINARISQDLDGESSTETGEPVGEHSKSDIENSQIEHLASESSEHATAVIHAIAKRRGMVLQGGAPDEQRAMRILLEDFRQGKLGKFSLE